MSCTETDVSSPRDVVQDETLVTEITLAPDGRVFVFGASRQTLEALHSVFPQDDRLGRTLAHMRSLARPHPQS